MQFIEAGFVYKDIPDAPRSHRDPVTPYALAPDAEQLYLHPATDDNFRARYRKNEALVSSTLRPKGKRSAPPPVSNARKQIRELPINVGNQYLVSEGLPILNELQRPVATFQIERNTLHIETDVEGEKRQRIISPGEEATIEHQRQEIEYRVPDGTKEVDSKRGEGTTTTRTWETKRTTVYTEVRVQNHGTVAVLEPN